MRWQSAKAEGAAGDELRIAIAEYVNAETSLCRGNISPLRNLLAMLASRCVLFQIGRGGRGATLISFVSFVIEIPLYLDCLRLSE